MISAKNLQILPLVNGILMIVHTLKLNVVILVVFSYSVKAEYA